MFFLKERSCKVECSLEVEHARSSYLKDGRSLKSSVGALYKAGVLSKLSMRVPYYKMCVFSKMLVFERWAFFQSWGGVFLRVVLVVGALYKMGVLSKKGVVCIVQHFLSTYIKGGCWCSFEEGCSFQLILFKLLVLNYNQTSFYVVSIAILEKICLRVHKGSFFG